MDCTETSILEVLAWLPKIHCVLLFPCRTLAVDGLLSSEKERKIWCWKVYVEKVWVSGVSLFVSFLPIGNPFLIYLPMTLYRKVYMYTSWKASSLLFYQARATSHPLSNVALVCRQKICSQGSSWIAHRHLRHHFRTEGRRWADVSIVFCSIVILYDTLVSNNDVNNNYLFWQGEFRSTDSITP